MKYYIKLNFIVFITLIAIPINGLSKTSGTYSGTVVPIYKGNINAGAGASYWGSLDFAARWGAITKPEITDLNGKEVQPGTTLSLMRKQYWRGQVITAKGQLIASKKNLTIARENYLRYKKLYPTGAVPVRTYQEMRAIFFEAVGQYETAKANLYEQESVYKQCRQISPIEGIIDKVYYSRGILTSDPKVIQLEQLNPIGIKVNMSTNETEKISPTTPVTIYPQGSDSHPIGIYNGYSLLCYDGIIFTTRNKPKRYADVQQVTDCLPIVYFYIGSRQSKKLGIPTPALHKDKKGYYAWKAVGRKVMQPGKGIDPVFKIKKVYIVPGKIKRLYNGITDMQILDDPGELELYDIVVSAPTVELKDGETVCLPPERYIFMPGDKVKVVIGISSNDIAALPKETKNKSVESDSNPSIDIRNRKIGHHTR